MYMKKISILLIVLVVFSFGSKVTNAFGECDQYGLMAMYDSFSRTCSCMSGYSFGKDFLGNTSCISDDQLCKDQYGYHASSDYLSGKCKCGYGYVFGKNYAGRTQCVSADSLCTDQLGYNSSYNSLSGDCECSYGYIISGGKCVNANTFCSSAHGIYSSYDRLGKSCKCDSGYTPDDFGQCVEKQNNAYFKLLDIDESSDSIIVQSDYSKQNYLLEYGIGCDLYIDWYLGKNLVINLGTDLYINMFDKIVLQDHNATCSIMSYEPTSDDSFKESEETFYVPAPVIVPVKTNTQSTPKIPPTAPVVSQENKVESKDDVKVEEDGISVAEEITGATQELEAPKISWYKRLWRWIFGN